MNKWLRIGMYVIGSILVLLLLVYLFFYFKWQSATSENMALLGEAAPTISVDGRQFRDLNKNGQLDIYEDHRADIDLRVEDLLAQMNLEEKAGTMFITMAGMRPDGTLLESPVFGDIFTFLLETNTTLIAGKKLNHFNTIQSPSAEAMAAWNNNIQKLAERTRLGIPITIASDPRHSAIENPGASIPTPFFSHWCSTLGFAAIDDTVLMREFADIARQEYIALGIRLALSPMSDLATEPRWGRINGTFGEDAELSARLTKAYILGFQGDSLGPGSVACMAKHFPGGGPQKDGEDAHFPYGKEQVYPGDQFDYHLIPFEKGVFPANAAQMMPYYGIPVGQTSEEVAFAFNKEVITGMLREKYNYQGVVCTDWGLVSDLSFKPAAAWGVEHLNEEERAKKIIDAGCDMFGGEASPEWVINLVNSGQISEERIDQSIRRILKDKFRLGLFDNPYVDESDLSIVGNAEFMAKGIESQQRSLVLLKNDEQILPLKKGTKVYLQGIQDKAVQKYADIVSSPTDADYIILKLDTPYEPRDEYMLEQFFRQGRLHFTAEEKNELLALIQSRPTITVINLQRPAVIPDINSNSRAVIADFDSKDEIILDLIFGGFQPSGKLPFEMPSSVQAVESQQEDVPYDSEKPLYPFGHGLTYELP